jgi:type II secretory pathway component PulC
MINKIRNLFNKLKKNKTSDDQFEDDFSTTNKDLDLPPVPSQESVDQFDQTGSFDEDSIDLDQGKLSFRDSVSLKLHSLRNSLGRIKLTKPKKMKIIDESKKTSRSIKIPRSFSNNSTLKKINFSNIHNDFFSIASRQKLHRIFQYSFVLLIIFTTAKSMGIILNGKSDYKKLPVNASIEIDKTNLFTSKNINQIKLAKLFKTEAKKVQVDPQKPLANTNLACVKADAKSKLPIKLINTIVLQDEVKSIASVQLRSESLLQELRVGEKIGDLAKIDRIEGSTLIVKNLKTGTCESISNDEKEDDYSPIAVLSPAQSKIYKKKIEKIDGVENDGNKFVIEKEFLKKKMSNIQDILTQARGIQINNPDGTISFKIVDVQPGGIFAHLGIQNNDIITQIDGQPINDLNAIMSLFGKLTNIDKLGLGIKRDGVVTPQEYKFK